MKIICLTDRDFRNEYPIPRKLYIAADKIIEFYKVDEQSTSMGTRILLMDKNIWTVHETPEQIMEKLNENP